MAPHDLGNEMQGGCFQNTILTIYPFKSDAQINTYGQIYNLAAQYIAYLDSSEVATVLQLLYAGLNHISIPMQTTDYMLDWVYNNLQEKLLTKYGSINMIQPSNYFTSHINFAKQKLKPAPTMTYHAQSINGASFVGPF